MPTKFNLILSQRTGFTLKWTTGDMPDLVINGVMGADALEFVRDSIGNALIRSRDANANNAAKSRVLGLQRWNDNLYSECLIANFQV